MKYFTRIKFDLVFTTLTVIISVIDIKVFDSQIVILVTVVVCTLT